MQRSSLPSPLTSASAPPRAAESSWVGKSAINSSSAIWKWPEELESCTLYFGYAVELVMVNSKRWLRAENETFAVRSCTVELSALTPQKMVKFGSGLLKSAAEISANFLTIVEPRLGVIVT